MIDLAGSERASKTQNGGNRLKEASNINQSLTVLGRCLEIMRWNQRHPNQHQRVVPFRESKITRFFQDSLNSKGKVVMIVNVSPSRADLDETIHALRFSAIAKEIDTQSKVYSRKDPRNTLESYSMEWEGEQGVKMRKDFFHEIILFLFIIFFSFLF